MITRSTVFILGAGASIPYKYPSGKQLVREIKEGLLEGNDLFQSCLALEFTKREIEKFNNVLRFSGDFSIDAFLERNDDYLELGKVAIALSLFKREDTSELFSEGDENWYGDLVNELKSPSKSDFKNEVSFLTFNYDRSFDQYLFASIKHSYEISNEECKSLLKNNPIIHLHGQVGKLPWQVKGGKGRPYDKNFNALSLINDCSASKNKYSNYDRDNAVLYIRHEISDQIKIIHENELDNDPAFKEAHKFLKDAERVYFLGFGYNDENLRRLKIADLSENITKEVTPGSTTTVRRTIEGTAHETGEVRRNQIYSANNIELHEKYKVKRFIKERVDFS
ncbi:MAG: hypothetical protein ACUZ8N_07520 [Candidatus Scalindua sp.]